MRPLDGVVVRAGDDAGPTVVATRFLAALGARVGDADASVVLTAAADATGGEPCARLVGSAVGDVAGLPPGTLTHANGLALAGAAVLALLSGDDVVADRRQVAVQVLLPLVLAASSGQAPRQATPPRPIGGGFVQADLATDEDGATFERLLASLGPLATDPRAVADEAQTWRLPVCAYEPHPPTAPVTPDEPGEVASDSGGGTGVPLAGMVVTDLTAMWAGPLATALLAAAGAEVHKVSPAARPDGTLGTPLYDALNHAKHVHDLDAVGDRDELEALLRRSDLVVDSFSRRVMPNLGLPPDRLTAWGVASLSMPAFPAGHRWQLALGPGIHASSGLGDLGDGRVSTPVVAYPDPLAALAAFATAVAMRRAAVPCHEEVTLYEPTATLAATSPPSDLVAERDPDLGPRLVGDLGRPLWGAGS